MADTIDVDKLKNDAFSAIDALFSDDEDTLMDDEISEELSDDILDESVAPEGDFDMLEEYTLALDWEYSDKEINRFLEQLEKIAAEKTDNYNQALIKMLKSIVNYLCQAQSMAYPETLNVMTYVLQTLKTINKSDFDQSLVKDEVTSAYQEVTDLQKKIAEYNLEIKKNRDDEPEEQPGQNVSEQAQEVQAVKEEKIIPEEVTVEEEVAADTAEEFQPERVLASVDEKEDIEQQTADEIEISHVIDPESVSPEPLPDMKVDPEIMQKLEKYEERFKNLEEQNYKLRQMVIALQESFDSEVSQTLLSEDTPPIGNEAISTFDFGNESVDEDDAVLVDLKDILIDSKAAEEDDLDLFETQYEIEANDDTLFRAQAPQFPESAAVRTDKKNFVEYVRFFKLGDQILAFPEAYINNVYKIPPKLKKNIQNLDSITLGDFSSMLQSLSRNMKGDLQGMSNKELKELNVEINLLSSETVDYNFAVLCTKDDISVIVPISKKYKSKLSLVTGMEKAENAFSNYSVEVEGIGLLPLIMPS